MNIEYNFITGTKNASDFNNYQELKRFVQIDVVKAFDEGSKNSKKLMEMSMSLSLRLAQIQLKRNTNVLSRVKMVKSISIVR